MHLIFLFRQGTQARRDLCRSIWAWWHELHPWITMYRRARTAMHVVKPKKAREKTRHLHQGHRSGLKKTYLVQSLESLTERIFPEVTPLALFLMSGDSHSRAVRSIATLWRHLLPLLSSTYITYQLIRPLHTAS